MSTLTANSEAHQNFAQITQIFWIVLSALQ